MRIKKSISNHITLLILWLLAPELWAIGSINNVTLMTEIPMNVVATAESSTSIMITWDDVVDDNGYIVEMSTEMGSGFVEKGQTEMDVTMFTVDNLPNHSTEYFFRVAAKGMPNSDYSAVVSATTNAPEPPGNLAADQITAVSVVLTWDDINFEVGYRIEQSDDGGANFALAAEADTDAETFTINGLTPSTDYQFQIAGKLGITELTDFSDALPVTTSAPVVPNGVPNGVMATVLSTSEIKIDWNDQSNNETGFQIERSDFIDGNFKAVATVDADVTTYTSDELTANTTYYFRVVAFNDEGSTTPSPSVSATTDVGAPEAPTGLVETEIGTTEISIEWSDNSAFETSYRVDLALEADFSSIAELEADTEVYTITGLMEATQYSIRVVAVNTTGETPSNTIDVTTTQEPPGAPTDLTFGLNNAGDVIRLTWVDNATNEEGFAVEKSVGDTENFEEIEGTEADVTTLTDNIEVGSNVFYRVRAFNEGGFSEYSNTTGNVLASVNDNDRSKGVDIYPSPSSGRFQVRIEGGQDFFKQVVIYDYTGRVVFRNSNIEGLNAIPVDLSKAPEGLYMIVAETEGQTYTGKVLLSR